MPSLAFQVINADYHLFICTVQGCYHNLYLIQFNINLLKHHFGVIELIPFCIQPRDNEKVHHLKKYH